jgi:hypothetical protein
MEVGSPHHITNSSTGTAFEEKTKKKRKKR